MRILIVEDERRIASFIERGLREQKFVIDITDNGEDALYFATENPYDLILLDIMIPKMDGISVCKELRARKIETPILMLTARNAVNDRIEGLNAGADDYLSKPFAFGELLARVRALLRRERKEKTSILKAGDLELNQLTQEVKRQGKTVALTPKEYGILEYLMLHENQVVTRTMISEHVWNEQFDSFTNVIDVHIKYLRNKIDKDFDKKFIRTRRGVGYVFQNTAS